MLQSPVGVSVAHRVMTRVLLIFLVHLEANPFDATLLHFVLVAVVLRGSQRRGLGCLIDGSLSSTCLDLCRLGDG